MAPCACHPLGSSTMGSRAFALTHGVLATLPPHRRVLCQVLACWWHEDFKVWYCHAFMFGCVDPGVIAVTLASPRGSQCFRISALSEGHRGYTRISPDLCECPPLAFSLHCDPSQFRHFPHTYLSPSHLYLSRVLTPSPILTSDRRLLRRAPSQRRWLLTPGP